MHEKWLICQLAILEATTAVMQFLYVAPYWTEETISKKAKSFLKFTYLGWGYSYAQHRMSGPGMLISKDMVPSALCHICFHLMPYSELNL
jgi:hypothetical protein